MREVGPAGRAHTIVHNAPGSATVCLWVVCVWGGMPREFGEGGRGERTVDVELRGYNGVWSQGVGS